eukprot:scaffold110937_cov36-Phaeocystis_antarctica.AAC.2
MARVGQSASCMLAHSEHRLAHGIWTLFTRLYTGAERRVTTSSAAAASCMSGGRRRTARPRSGSGPCRSRQGRR